MKFTVGRTDFQETTETFAPELVTHELENLNPDTVTEFASRIQTARRTDLDPYKADDRENDAYETPQGNEAYWPGGGEELFKHMLTPEEKRICNEVFSSESLTKLGHGVARIAFTLNEIDDFVVKVGRWGTGTFSPNGVIHNEVEAQAYLRSRDALDLPLLPIVAADPDWNWVIQPRAETMNEVFPEQEFEALEHPIQERLFEETSCLRHILSTEGCLPHNIGKWRGDWYIFDYARPKVVNYTEMLKQIQPEDCA